ncbi:MAG: DUF3857 domain-containing protein [Candidatus Brocadiia bacterium]
MISTRKDRILRMSRLVFLLLAGISWVATAAETKKAAEMFPDGFLDQKKVIEAAKKVTGQKYPNAEDVLVDDHIRVRYFEDGTSRMWDDWYVKILTEKGRRERATLEMHFTIPYSLPEDIQVKKLEVIKPDGRIVKVDVKSQSRVMIDPSQRASNIYNPNSKVLVVNVASLEVGDLVHYFTYKRVRHPRVRNVWADMQIFEYTSPIKHYSYEVIGPSERPLRNIALKDPVGKTVTHSTRKEGGLLHHRWEATDVPRMFREPNMPSLHRVVQRVLVSTAPDWESISKWYWEISSPHYEVTPRIKKKVKALTDNAPTRKEKIRAIFNFVSQQVRYLGITKEDTAPGYEPHDVSDTFENLAGVCRDKAALLVVMLREAGFQAYPVLIHTGPRKDPDVPLPWFNHAIACVQKEDGEGYQLMDPTDETTRRLLPAYLNNCSYLVARPDGEELRVSPIIPATENLMHISTVGSIDAEGNLTATSTLRFDGQNDNGYRGYFARLKPVERRRYFSSIVKRVVPGAKLTGFELFPQKMQDTSRQLEATLKLEATEVPISDEEFSLLPIPLFGTNIGYAHFILRGGTGLETRKYPLKTDIACGVNERLEITLDPALGSMKSLPTYPEIDHDTIAWKASLDKKDNKIIGTSRFLLKAVEFTPKQYANLKNVLGTIEYNQRKMPVLQRTANESPEDGADAVVLEERVSYHLKDQHNWTETRSVRRKILTYAGKKHYSEVKLRYNEAWETLKLKNATVTTPDGTVKNIPENQINRMDASWVGSAPRFPKTKVLVASLPGVSVGSTIEYTVVKKNEGKPFFSAQESFRDFEPVLKKSLEIIAPSSMKLKTMQTGERIKYDESTLSGPHVRRLWQVKNLDAIKRERYLPPLFTLGPTVFVSTGSWEKHAEYVTGILHQRARKIQKTVARAKELTAGKKALREKVIAIRDFIARNIRLAGPKIHEAPLAVLATPDKTLADGYGSSAERAVVFYVMLRQIGLKPQFVLVSQAPRAPDLWKPIRQIPHAAWFPGVLVRVEVDNKPIYLNDTGQYAALGATHYAGRPGLTQNGTIAAIEPPESFEDRSFTRYAMAVTKSGDAVIQKTRRFYGISHGNRKKHWAELAPEERNRQHQELISALSQSAEPKGKLRTHFKSYPGEELFAARWERFAVREGNFLYFRIPESFADLFHFMADERENPLYFARNRRHTLIFDIVLPSGWKHTRFAPPPIDWQSPSNLGRIKAQVKLISPLEQKGDENIPWVLLETTNTKEPRRTILRISYDVDLQPGIIDADRYDLLLDIMRRLKHLGSRTVCLTSDERE